MRRQKGRGEKEVAGETGEGRSEREKKGRGGDGEKEGKEERRYKERGWSKSAGGGRESRRRGRNEQRHKGSEGTLYLLLQLCRRLFVYIPRTANGDGPFDMSPLAKMLKDKRGKTFPSTPLVLLALPAKVLASIRAVLAAIENAMKRGAQAAARTRVSAISLCGRIMNLPKCRWDK